MASYTTNLNLKKPAGSENVAIGDINNNMDAIDQAYGALDAKYETEFAKRIYTTSESAYSYTFAINNYAASRYWFALMYIGTNNDATGFGLYAIHINNGSVNVFKIAGNNGRAFTGSVSGSNLTITETSSNTVWGGIRVIMPN